MSQDYLDKLIEKDKAGTQIQSIPLHDTELRGITIDDPITVEGNPINFSTKNEQNAIQTMVDLDPIQDLHGYSKPWVGGAGKNLLPLNVATIKSLNTGGTWSGNVYTLNTAIFTLVTDSDNNVVAVKVKGSAPSGTHLTLNIYSNLLISSATIISSGHSGESTPYILEAYRNDGTKDYFYSDKSGYIPNIPANVNLNRIRLVLLASQTVSGEAIIEPMIRLSTVTDATFEPYTNICPILPHEEIKIGGCGKNLCPDTLENGGVDDYGNDTLASQRCRIDDYIKVKPNTEYSFKALSDNGVLQYVVRTFEDDKHSYRISDNGGFSQGIKTFVTQENAHFIKIIFGYYGDNTINANEIYNVQLEEGSTVTDYEPYTISNNLSIDLPSTVYGGTLNLETGKLVVDRKFTTVNDLGWYNDGGNGNFRSNNTDAKRYTDTTQVANMVSSHWPIVTQKGHSETEMVITGLNWIGSFMIWNTGASETAELKSLYGDAQICYELDDSYKYTIQLTPHQLKLFKDVNNLNSSDYTTLTVTYHSNSIATLAPATDTKDGLLSAIDKRALDRTEEIVEGNPIQFETESAQVAKSTIIDLEPIQDLHGFDKPWVGGAGKNLLPLIVDNIKTLNTSDNGTWNGNIYTSYYGITYTILTDSDNNVTGIKVNGNSTAYFNFVLGNIITTGNEILNGTAQGSSGSSYRLDVYDATQSKQYVDLGSGVTIADAGNYACRIVTPKNITVNNVIFYPMIRLSTVTDATFEPYTNIASISGRSEVDILGCGKNLLPNDIEWYRNNAGDFIGISDSSTTRIRTTSFAIISGNYILSGIPSGSLLLSVRCYDKDKTRLSDVTISNNAFTLGSEVKYIHLLFGGTDYTSSTNTEFANANILLEKGNQATGYEPYTKSNDLTISLGQTVYGGQLDVENGVLVVTHKTTSGKIGSINTNYSNLDYGMIGKADDSADKGNYDYHDTISSMFAFENASSDWNNVNKIGKAYAGASITYYWFGFSKGTTLEDMQTITNDNIICYELSTPTTISLTPEQVKLLQGVNTITTNADNITLTYRNGSVATLNDLESLYAKLKAYIDSLHSS